MQLASNPVMTTIASTALSASLKVLKQYMSQEDFKHLADYALNAIEGFFDEDSWPDQVAETITAGLREDLGIEDSTPDN
jgi:hypothetical protein